MLRKIVAFRQRLVTASGLSVDKRAMCIVFSRTRNYNEPACNSRGERMEAIAGGPAWEEESRFCAPPPVAGSALARGDQTLIRQANHPVGIGDRDCDIGELLPELGLGLRARGCHDQARLRLHLS